jgi:hypothetical protein
LEVGLRVSGRGDPSYSDYINKAANGYYAQDTENIFHLLAGFRGTQDNNDRSLPGEPSRVSLTTDKREYRTTVSQRNHLGSLQGEARSSKEVLFLGDSYTFGLYLRDEHAIPSFYKQHADRVGVRLDVINAGYADGHETDQIYAWLYQHVLALKPDIIVYCFFAGNDILGIDPKSWRETSPEGLPTKWINSDLTVRKGILKSKAIRAPLYIYNVPILRESKLLATIEAKARFLRSSLLSADRKGPSNWAFSHMYGVKTRDYLVKGDIF